MSGRLEPVAVALDTADRETFSAWVARFAPRVGVLKVGLEAFLRFGAPAVAEARRAGGRVFLDLKLHDIPNTVAGAVAAAAALEVDYLTVHAGGGSAMLAAAVE
ncbi:MAG: orotidine 5'-phosphate decarboxylase, partial [Thermoanaerobaculia bacterium]|nr:orotidine 5'-phosphate decarboxylase [Thermoanaerobaculia bacterium]